MLITRGNIDQLLDEGRIEVAMTGGKWWKIRRNGQTKRWKKDKSRIHIPFKMGFNRYGVITELDFNEDGELKHFFRLTPSG